MFLDSLLVGLSDASFYSKDSLAFQFEEDGPFAMIYPELFRSGHLPGVDFLRQQDRNQKWKCKEIN